VSFSNFFSDEPGVVRGQANAAPKLNVQDVTELVQVFQKLPPKAKQALVAQLFIVLMTL
jgi:hypothetical protein